MSLTLTSKAASFMGGMNLLHTASGMRRPIVMVNVNRSAGLSWNLMNDQIDSLAQRDTGWLQFYAENAQESLDTVIMAFKIAEHTDVQLPVMVVTEDFTLSHTGESVEIPQQDLVDAFLPPFRTTSKLDIDNPRAFGGFMTPIKGLLQG
jgi:pyruvate/2-oxoacid:ferredoxin oxidoreductase alpha subunit